MQLPIVATHKRPSIGHRAIGAAAVTFAIALAGVASWALVATSGGESTDAGPTNVTTSASPETAQVVVLSIDASAEDATAIQRFADGLAGPGRVRVENLRAPAPASVGVGTVEHAVLIVGSEAQRLDVAKFLDTLPARERALLVIHVASPDVSQAAVADAYRLAGIVRVVDLRAD